MKKRKKERKDLLTNTDTHHNKHTDIKTNPISANIDCLSPLKWRNVYSTMHIGTREMNGINYSMHLR